MSQEGMRKSAILLMALGEDAAVAVLRHLNSAEVEQLGQAMMELRQVSNEEFAATLEEFRQETEQFTALSIDSSNYIRSVLEKTLGMDRAAEMIDDINSSHEVSPAHGIDALNTLDAQEIVELIRGEHPQILATLLVHLERNKASEILEKLDENLRNDVVLRVATFGGVQPEALEELTTVFSNLLSGGGVKRSRLGGVRAAAEMINSMNSAQEEGVISHVREYDQELAQQIIDEMFVFENLLDMENRSVQLLLKEIDYESLIIALKGASQELRDKFTRNMSSRAAEILLEDLENRGPVRLSQVEAEQKAILRVVRRMADSGEIVILGQGKDEYV